MKGPKSAFDTSVVVAGLLGWHEHHELARAALDAALAGKGRLVLPLPVLIEAYAVMTRLPRSLRVAPEVALELLLGTFQKTASVVGLDGSEGWGLIRALAGQGLAGGATYDAHVVSCARAAGCDELVTFNERDFARLDLGGIRLVIPR